MMGDNRDNSTDSRVLSEVGVTCRSRTWSAEPKIIFFSIDEDSCLWQSLGMADRHPLEPHVRADALTRVHGARPLSTSSPGGLNTRSGTRSCSTRR